MFTRAPRYLNFINISTIELLPDIDHLIYTAPTLEQGIEKIEALLGVQAVIGGRHPLFGTQNALLSIGESTYLEIVAPDLSIAPPKRGRWLATNFDQQPKLTTWVLHSENIEQQQEKAIKHGLKLGAIEAGKREKPDGTILTWVLTDPYALPYDGAIPFLINWGTSTHPAKTTPDAGNLVGLDISHPEPDKVLENLGLLGVRLEIKKSDKAKLTAKIETKNGLITLE